MRGVLWSSYLATLFLAGSALLLIISVIGTHDWWKLLLLLGCIAPDVILGHLLFAALLSVVVTPPVGILFALNALLSLPVHVSSKRLEREWLAGEDQRARDE